MRGRGLSATAEFLVLTLSSTIDAESVFAVANASTLTSIYHILVFIIIIFIIIIIIVIIIYFKSGSIAHKNNGQRTQMVFCGSGLLYHLKQFSHHLYGSHVYTQWTINRWE